MSLMKHTHIPSTLLVSPFISCTLISCTIFLLIDILNNANYNFFCSGPASPEPPNDLLTDSVTTHSATVSWTVPTIAFTPETYVVHYGTNLNNLQTTSDQIIGLSNFTARSHRFLITLTVLTPNTIYFYHINATNSIGSVLSQTANFITALYKGK